MSTTFADPAEPHCTRHEAFTEGCGACGMARVVAADRTETVYPRGVPKRVPRDECRCPILMIGDFCPVHGG